MDGAEQLGQGGFLAVLLVFSERPRNGRMPPAIVTAVRGASAPTDGRLVARVRCGELVCGAKRSLAERRRKIWLLRGLSVGRPPFPLRGGFRSARNLPRASDLLLGLRIEFTPIECCQTG